MSVILIGALLGYMVAGTGGLFGGAIVGFLINRGLHAVVVQNAQRVQSHFVEATFAVMGAVCKADGQVTPEEIRAAEHVFDQLHLSGAQREGAKAAFNRGKAADFDLDGEIDKIAGLGFNRGPLFQVFLQVQCMAVIADGQVHPAEHAMLVHIAERFGLSAHDVARLEALLRATEAAGTRTSTERLADAYVALDLTPRASENDIKRAYRKLMSANHPDKLAAKGLPESMREAAEERTREINVAYELIKDARGF